MLNYNYALEYKSRPNSAVHEASLKGRLRNRKSSRLEGTSLMLAGYIGPSSTAPNLNAQIVTTKDFPNAHPK